MPLGMEVGLGPGHIVLDAAQLLHPKGGRVAVSHFSTMSIVVKRLGGLRCHLVRR